MSDEIGKFVGCCNFRWNLKYTEVGVFSDVPHPWFDFQNDDANPLTYILSNKWIRPAQSLATDFGSVPSELQTEVGPLDCPCAYVFHDSAFENHGWWESYDQGKSWNYVPKTQHEVDEMLRDMAVVEGVDWVERNLMFAGVEVGGTQLWNNHKGPFPVDPAPIGAQ